MQKPFDLTPTPVDPTQVWAQLPAERQGQAIRLMARLAYTLALAYSNPPVAGTSLQRSRHDTPTRGSQDPT